MKKLLIILGIFIFAFFFSLVVKSITYGFITSSRRAIKREVA